MPLDLLMGPDWLFVAESGKSTMQSCCNRSDGDTLQQQCDRLTQAVLWRRSRQDGNTTVYLVEIVRGEEVGVAIVCHDTACIRSVRCGGNPGMPYADRFRGEQNPVFEFRGWCRRIFELRGWDTAEIEAVECRPEPM